MALETGFSLEIGALKKELAASLKLIKDEKKHIIQLRRQIFGLTNGFTEADWKEWEYNCSALKELVHPMHFYMPLEHYEINQRTINLFENAGINTLGEICALGTSRLPRLVNLSRMVYARIQAVALEKKVPIPM